MSEETITQEPQEQAQADKEMNFRKLEAKYERQLEQIRQENASLKQAQAEYEQKLNQFQKPAVDEDYDDYIDGRKLQRRFSDFEKNLDQKYDKKAEEKANAIIAKKEKEMWLRNNPDFYKTLEEHADHFAKAYPDLADDILAMPKGFERERIVYNNIKHLGIDKPKESIQEKVDQRQKGLYYQPSGVSNSPYSTQSDYSPQGQKKAYEHMKELQSRLRI